MADERVVHALSAWLLESDVPPPDAQMSAGRVMASVEQNPRLRRWWPPARFAPKAEVAPALGAFGPTGPPPRPVPRVQPPRVREKVRQILTSPRALAIITVSALVLSAAAMAASLSIAGS